MKNKSNTLTCSLFVCNWEKNLTNFVMFNVKKKQNDREIYFDKIKEREFTFFI